MENDILEGGFEGDADELTDTDLDNGGELDDDILDENEENNY